MARTDRRQMAVHCRLLCVAVAVLSVAAILLQGPTPAKAADPGIDWTSQTTPVDNDWTSVAHGNGLFVAVASSGAGNRVMTSPDGVDWTLRTTPANNFWTSVTFGDGLFVAVAAFGPEGLVMTSPDGINWTIRTAASENVWSSVTFGNGLFVAVAETGTGDRVMTSPDGINWTARTSAANNTWKSVTFGGGLFVAVASSGAGNRVMTSPDGINWTARTSAADNIWLSVTHGNGQFVAVSFDGAGNRVMTSPDGINWTIRASAADNGWRAVTHGTGLFVAVSGSGAGNRVMTSPDGINWTIRTSAADRTWNSVVHGDGSFVAVAFFGTGNRAMSSGPAPEVLSAETTGTGSGTVTSDPQAIDCGPESVACERGFPPDSTVTLTATPGPGSVFAGWSGACAGLGTCEVTMDAAKSVTAEFQLGVSLIVVTTGNGSGDVTSNPAGIDCGSTCASIFLGNTVVSLTAAPEPGSVFTGWSGACSGTGPCDLTMDGAKAVTAEFTPEYSLTVSRTGNGGGAITSTPAGIDCGLICSSAFLENTVVNLAASPDGNSEFTGWSGACSGTGPCQVLMDEAKSASAEFTLKVIPPPPPPPPPPDPAAFSRIGLTPKKKTLKAGKKLKLTVSVTNSGGLAGTATVNLTSSNRKKLKVPKSIRLEVPAGRTVKKTFTVKSVKRKKGKFKVTAKLAGRTARSAVTVRG